MITVKLESFVGNTISEVAETAKLKAIKESAIVEFDFNEVMCRVSPNTNVKHLVRDYMNAHLMKWKTVGFDCLEEYTEDIKEQISHNRKMNKLKRDAEMKSYREKADNDKKEFHKVIDGVGFEAKNKAEYDDWKSKNKDGYGSAIFEYAENWGRMLQTKIGVKPINELIEDFDLQPNYLGISGFQHGAAIQILKKCWINGDNIN